MGIPQSNADLFQSPLPNVLWLDVALIDGPAVKVSKAFADSIAKLGVIVPLVVGVSGERYRIVAGRRRLHSARDAGQTKVPAIVHTDVAATAIAAMTIAENLHRSRSIASELQAFRDLVKAGLTDDEIQALLCLPKRDFKQLCSLLNLVPAAQQLLERGAIAPATAKIMAKLSVRQQEQLLTELEPDQRLTLDQVRAWRLKCQYHPAQLSFLRNAIPTLEGVR